MSENSFAEYSTVDGCSVQMFAMLLDTDKLVWSISSGTGGVGVQIGDSTPAAVESLKQLRKSIDGAIKFMNDKQKEINGGKEKNNDETAK